ncbi:RNA polymerase factor sigma-54 [Clostridium formicaceticum]|uniref:RNA polymerase sigma-54 factor n=1 Tax=Clostridium formicaceticum TaxID=1497 RepID=A0AAC9WH40_9CLOT|nr:RNA polymerase factor sigma-54 [Clostridium formicaceticum]AOY77894.1 RNA polymerase sigma-54 factor [Clostridium formicaceticum]ARE88513.1 RNA polymerase sigma-54 factor 1 [Clostridium formicaceticum]
MKMGYNLHLEQSQKLIMTPQLKQAIKILQLATFELDQYIQHQVEINPILEVTPPPKEDKYTAEVEKRLEEKINWKEYLEDFNNYEYSKPSYNEDNQFNYENIVSTNTTLQEHLLFQYNIAVLDYRYKEIGEYIIDNLNENGYLIGTVEEIAKELGEEVDTVESILEIIQTFDPAGVAARNLKECLLIQLRQLGINNDDKVCRVVEEYLEEVAQNKYPYVAKKLGIDVKEVQEICDFIRTLEPKPGRKFASVSNHYIVPDAAIKKMGGEYFIILNDKNLPSLTIREDYKKLIASEGEDTEAAKFLNDKLNSAVWLIRSIEQRRQTIYKVVEVIVKKQKNFFEHGKKHLKPLTLKEIAEEIEVHESTVSRATNGKYVDTPMGVFELKYFFSSGVGAADGDGISAESIKNHMREIIEAENPCKPWSDDKIAKLLGERGIMISRRTVAKYREDMQIASSSKRKRYQ